LHNEEHHNLYYHLIKKDEIGRAFSMRGRD